MSSTVMPYVQTMPRGDKWPIAGVAASGGPDALALDVQYASCPEDAIVAVSAAIDARRPLWTGRRWMQFNPAMVIAITCDPFDA